jgi:AcrR family transcriptional regulator
MPAPTRTPRSSWIDEGLRALGVGGPDAVRVEALAQALGMSEGGFYWHCDDRRALLSEMLDAWERAVIDEATNRVEGGGGARARSCGGSSSWPPLPPSAASAGQLSSGGGGLRSRDAAGTAAALKEKLDACASALKLSWKLYAVASSSLTGATWNRFSM